MTKKDLAKAIAEKAGIPQVQAGRIELRNFGVFAVKRRKPRKARNPRTGDKVKVPAKLVVTFKAAERWRSGSGG